MGFCVDITGIYVIIIFMDIKCFSVGLLRTNCYIINASKNAIIIDPGFRSTLELTDIEKYINEKDLNVKAVLLTHCHLDHIMGVDIIIQRFHCPVFISQNDAEGFYDPVFNLSKLISHHDFVPESSVSAFADGAEINIADISLKAYITPGHTPGSAIFICDDIIFTGDTLFHLSVGRTDLAGGDFNALSESLTKIKRLCCDKCYRILPGHGPETTSDFEFENNDNYKRG